MEIFLYPNSHKGSCFFDEYYSGLFSQKEIAVRELKELNIFPGKIFSFLMREHKYLIFRNIKVFYLNFILRKHKDAIVHFSTQLSVIPQIKNKYIFTYHDVLHMIPQLTGVFYSLSLLKNIDMAVYRAERVITVSQYSKTVLGLYYPGITNISIIEPPILHPNNEMVYQRDNYHVLFIGSMHPRKNLYTILEAFALVEKKIKQSLKIYIVTNF
jgi:glycosyltransferase involved in cell wall biosynthesis